MPRVTIHVGGPEPLLTAGIHRQPMATDSTRLAVLVQLSTDACTASRRNADREGRSVPEEIVSPSCPAAVNPGQLPPQSRCLRAHSPSTEGHP
jgi:hypothetical protein